MNAIRKLSWYERFYLLGLSVITIYLLQKLTTSSLYHYIALVVEVLTWEFALLIFVLACSRYKGLEFLAIAIISLIVTIVGINCQNLFELFLMWTLVMGAKGVHFRSIIKTHFFVSLCFCAFNFFSYFGGFAKNASVYTEREGLLGDDIVRQDFCYGWSTDFALHMFYILLDFWILKNGSLKIWEFGMYVAGIYLSLFYADARLAAIGIFFLMALSIVQRFRVRGTAIFNKWKYLFICCIPFFACITYITTVRYDQTDIYWFAADIALSGRLHLGQDAILSQGITFWGQYYEMFGAGEGTLSDLYNFIDSSYLQSLVIWGVALSVIIQCAFVKICYEASKRGDLILLLAIFVAGITGMIAQFLFLVYFCPLLLAVFSSHEINHSLRNKSLESKFYNVL